METVVLRPESINLAEQSRKESLPKPTEVTEATKPPLDPKPAYKKPSTKQSIPYPDPVAKQASQSRTSDKGLRLPIELEDVDEQQRESKEQKPDTMKSLPSSHNVNPEIIEKKKHALEQISAEQFIKAKVGSYSSEYKMGKVLGEGTRE